MTRDDETKWDRAERDPRVGVRGLPRPLNAVGKPVPYIASDPRRLGEQDFTLAGEVLVKRLCQVWGDPVGETACGVTRQLPDFEGRIFGGMMHEGCARLSFQNCPELMNWHGMNLHRFAVPDLPIDRDNNPYIPAGAPEITPTELLAGQPEPT